MFRNIDLTVHGGSDGKLIALEQLSEQVPFELKRVYFIYDVRQDLRRGFHAHKKLKQLLVVVSGSCEILLDDGVQRSTVLLDRPDAGIIIERPLWREIYNFSSDCVLLVLASELYDTNDYISDYREFKRYVRVTNV